MRRSTSLANVAGATLCSVALFLFLSLAASAQQPGVAVDQVHQGATLVAQTSITIRNHPPSGGAVYVKGDQVGTLAAGDTISVTQEQTITTLLGAQKWVGFARGWVLLGRVGTTSDRFAKR